MNNALTDSASKKIRANAGDVASATIGDCALALLEAGEPVTIDSLVFHLEQAIAGSASIGGSGQLGLNVERVRAEEAIKRLRRIARSEMPER